MDRKPLEQMKAVSKYDPNQAYSWEPTDLFTVSGAEIDAWNKALAVVIQTPEYQRFTHVQRAAILMQDFIKQAAEQDLILPVAKPEVAKEVTEIQEFTSNGQPQ